MLKLYHGGPSSPQNVPTEASEVPKAVITWWATMGKRGKRGYNPKRKLLQEIGYSVCDAQFLSINFPSWKSLKPKHQQTIMNAILEERALWKRLNINI